MSRDYIQCPPAELGFEPVFSEAHTSLSLEKLLDVEENEIQSRNVTDRTVRQRDLWKSVKHSRIFYPSPDEVSSSPASYYSQGIQEQISQGQMHPSQGG